VVQGPAAAATFPQVIAIMPGSVPEEKRTVIFGAFGAFGAVPSPRCQRRAATAPLPRMPQKRIYPSS
jgi:hypothetical protein